jgi:taurine transport system ATP-binding protein
MSPRPGRLLERLPVPFARDNAERDVRDVKLDPAFIAIRERVLALIRHPVAPVVDGRCFSVLGSCP